MSTEYCIKCTLPLSYCVCLSAPKLNSSFEFSILLHPRELQRRTSTGRLLKMCCNLPSSNWHRLKNAFLANIYADYHLLYPASNNATPGSTPSISQDAPLKCNKFLLIDATWQESQKMLRQSPWLNALPKYSLSQQACQYHLRRNQTAQGLSTIESLAYCLIEQDQTKQGAELIHFLNDFQRAFLTARQAGLL